MQDFSANGYLQQQVPLDYTLHQQQPLPPPNFYPYPAHPGLNYMAPPRHPPLPHHQANHQIRMLQYYQHVSAAAFKHPDYPKQNVERFVAEKPAEPCPKPPAQGGDSSNAFSSKPAPNFRQFTIRDIASHFNVYIGKSIIEEAEVLLEGRGMNPKKIAKFLLLEIIGEEIVINQTASGGRTYKAADINILHAVEAIVNSRTVDRESDINIFKVFNTLSDSLRNKRRASLKKQGAAADAKQFASLKRPMSFSSSPTTPPNQPASPSLQCNQYKPQPQFTAAQHQAQQQSYPWGQPSPSKRPFLTQEQLPSFTASRFYSPATQSMPYASRGGLVTHQMPQQQQQVQPYWNYQQPHQQQYEGLAATLKSHSISPVSVEPCSSEMSSPPKTDSPYEGNLEICEDEELEDEAELVGALKASSQTSSQPFSQEFWEYQVQQDQYQEN